MHHCIEDSVRYMIIIDFLHNSLAFPYFPYFYTNNIFITSKFIVLYMSDPNFIIVA
jgi:hypothetical protein